MDKNGGMEKIEIPTLSDDIDIDFASDSDLSEMKRPKKKSKKSKHKNKLPSEDFTKEQMSLNRPWNYHMQLLLKKIGERSMGYKWMHMKEQYHNEKVDTIFSRLELIILALLGGLTSGELVNLVSDGSSKNNGSLLITLTIIQLVLVVSYAIVKGLRDNGTYSMMVWRNQYASSKFNEINLEIQQQFGLKIEDRVVDTAFLSNIIRSYNNLMEGSPTISSKIQKQYIDATADMDITRPVFIGDFDQIQIIIGDDNTQNAAKEGEEKSEDNESEKLYENKNRYELERYLRNF